MSDNWEGFYTGYMTGTDGQGFAMFVFHDGIIAGSDAMGVTFDGQYLVGEDGTLTGDVTVAIPPNGTVIQGVTAGPSGMIYKVPVKFAVNDFDLDYVQLETPLGPVNLIMTKLRGIGSNEPGDVG